MNQLSIFDFIESSRFCNDEEINKIVEYLDAKIEILKQHLPPIKRIKKEYEVWDHVPNLGYRLSYAVVVDWSFINLTDKFCGIGAYEINRLLDIEKIQSKSIEIDVCHAPNLFVISTLRKGTPHADT